ncbi:uncharacterized protein LOC133792253 [Humulus lupulus]|uniref:uncharacterized protein LOC133792253 n=1 Tax=Humulus lupulus TaxID=3486 RepID=UPI002B403630|nr:uncharacterized protein LOC133792253 [Humulus lupulus]
MENNKLNTFFLKKNIKDQISYRVRLIASVDCIRFLVRQGLAFCGHDESQESNNQGNFLKLLTFLANHNEEVRVVALKNAPENLKLTSPKIQKDIVNACAMETINVIIRDMEDVVFSILVDESRDVSIKEQMVVLFRYVDKRGCVIERFIGTFLTIVSNVVNVVGASSKRHDILREKQALKVIEGLKGGELLSGRGQNQERGIKRPCDTRWRSHFGTLAYTVALWLADSSSNLSASTTERDCLMARIQELEKELENTQADLQMVRTKLADSSRRKLKACSSPHSLKLLMPFRQVVATRHGVEISHLDMDSVNVFDIYSTPETPTAPRSKKKASKRHPEESSKAPQAKKPHNAMLTLTAGRLHSGVVTEQAKSLEQRHADELKAAAEKYVEQLAMVLEEKNKLAEELKAKKKSLDKAINQRDQFKEFNRVNYHAAKQLEEDLAASRQENTTLEGWIEELKKANPRNLERGLSIVFSGISGWAVDFVTQKVLRE